MGCFLVSAAEAAVVKVVETVEEKKEIKSEAAGHDHVEEVKIPLSRKLKWLTSLLTGGAVLLMFEHIWHGEVVPWFPFLTAMSNAEDAAAMFHEMATVGVCMALLITVVWGVMCVVADALVKKSNAEASEKA